MSHGAAQQQGRPQGLHVRPARRGASSCARRSARERFKLLYDIYHMQIMEGDVIRTIRDNNQYIGHYHTGGNPGRNEIDETQELNYPAIVKAIVATGYRGYLGQEFIPSATRWRRWPRQWICVTYKHQEPSKHFRFTNIAVLRRLATDA